RVAYRPDLTSGVGPSEEFCSRSLLSFLPAAKKVLLVAIFPTPLVPFAGRSPHQRHGGDRQRHRQDRSHPGVNVRIHRGRSAPADKAEPVPRVAHVLPERLLVPTPKGHG